MEYYTVANWSQFESLCFKLKGNLVLDYFKIESVLCLNQNSNND